MDSILKYFPWLTARQREQFEAMRELYEEWNGRINVISRRDMDEFYVRHVLHSLAVGRFLEELSAGRYFRPEQGEAGLFQPSAGRAFGLTGSQSPTHAHQTHRPLPPSGGAEGLPEARKSSRRVSPFPISHFPFSILDVGTGGGFPAVPLAVMFPGAKITAVDSIGKKIRVVDEVSRGLGLDNLRAVNGRAESVRGRFDFVVSRAVAPANKLIEWTFDQIVSSPSGASPDMGTDSKPTTPTRGMILLKGGDLTDELAQTGRPYIEKNISDWFDEPFFETKKVIFFRKNS